MIDNLELIKPLLTFESDDDYYFLQIIQRKKDNAEMDRRMMGKNNSARLIKSYFIKSVEQLEDQYYEIQQLCNLFNARAGICLNRRSFKASSLKALVTIAQSMESGNHKNHRVWNTVAGKYHPIKDKTWIIDVDEPKISPLMLACIDHECEPLDEDTKILARIPSKNGWHVITKPFNVTVFGSKYPDLDIHKNNPTNLYCP
jgi:hypothetical protein